jgi:hypothetical protein
MSKEHITLADILGPWVEPDWQSGLIESCGNAWNTPLRKLTNGQLAMLRQRFAVEHLLPIAQERLRDSFDDDTELSEGELERAIKDAEPSGLTMPRSNRGLKRLLARLRVKWRAWKYAAQTPRRDGFHVLYWFTFLVSS